MASQTPSPFRLVLIGAATLAVLFVGSVLMSVYGRDLRDYLFPEPFDSECWKQAGADEFNADCSRGAMRYSLVREHPLVGMERSEVEALLGPTGGTTYAHYSLGNTNHGINTGRLELFFGSDDTVTRCEIGEG